MQVLFESRDPQGAEMRDLTVQRVQLAMRRLSWLVPRAKVQLSDVNGPRGGVDKRCYVELKTNLISKVLLRNVRRNKSQRHVRLRIAEDL